MDTKWNSTDKNTAEALEPFAGGQASGAEPAPAADSGLRGRHVRAAAGFLAFFLGVSLVLGSLGAALGRMVWQRDSGEWWKNDWQETEVFRAEVSAYLKEFLTLAAGEELAWYNDWYESTAEGVLISGSGDAYFTVTESAESVPEAYPAYPADLEPDYWYQNDKNVLYKVCRYDQPIYRNTPAGESFSSYETLPEGYNFLLVFQDGKVSIRKDGEELDVYGGGFYTEDSDWFVPGYENFPAGDDVSHVKVYIAVRETPVQYYNTGCGVRTSDMYWPYQSFQESRSFGMTQAVLLGAGLLCLALWFLLRREKRLADEKLASRTAHIWTEARFLAVALSLACLLLPRAGSIANELWWELRYAGLSGYMLPYAGRALLACLDNTAALLCLFWSVWLIRNDHRYNVKSERRSLLRKLGRAISGLLRVLRMKELKRPIQKRLARNRAILLAVMIAVFAAALLVACYFALNIIRWGFWGYDLLEKFIIILPYLLAVCLLPCIIYTWRNRRFSRDIGLLADQVEAIRSGDLSTPLALPEDADLRQTAEALNDIQAGLHKALEEQTRSERMKVELVSNVSHDLKTPLTSILSYAELLRQEPLEGAAADYARIIDEKAQRLKGMVQDVFEVSKAAADQLPVHLERLDLAKLLRQTLADMDDPIRASQLTFKIDLPDGPVEIVADGRRLYRVFQNLIQNALQYALEGSRVYLSLKTGEGRAEASLRNTSRNELPEGVDFTARFVRGDESRSDGGSGLGLSIASSFTEACGGAFRVETVADLFTAVVTFPLAE